MKPDDQWKAVVGIVLLPFVLIWSLIDGAISLVKALIFTPEKAERDAAKLNGDLYEKAKAEQQVGPIDFLTGIIKNLPIRDSEHVHVIVPVLEEIWRLETLEVPKPPPVANSIEGARYRDTLSKLGDLRPTMDALTRSFTNFVELLPEKGDGLSFAMSMRDTVTGDAVQSIILPLFAENVRLPKLQHQLNRNLYRMAGVPFMAETSKPIVRPSQYKGDEPILKYLEHTPLLDLFDATVPLTIPYARRFEHTYVVGASGSGKTRGCPEFCV